MDCCDDRSASRRSTALFLLFVVISLLACSPLARSRQTITTVAPICASASAVAFPIPALAPVTMQIFPCIPGLAAHAHDAHSGEGGHVESLREKPDRQEEFEQASGNDPDQPQASHCVDDA